MKKFRALILAVASLAAAAVFSQPVDPLLVATGEVEGTYSTEFRELYGICKAEVLMTEKLTTGSVENVQLMLTNKVNAIFVQSDVAFFRKRTQDLSRFKTLLALHPEEAHFIALQPRQKAVVKPGFLDKLASAVGQNEPEVKQAVFNTLADLKGRSIGAAGGSKVTADLISAIGDVGYTTVPFGKNVEAIAALDSGAVDAILLVGGQPLESTVGKMDASKYRLLHVNPDILTKLTKDVYAPAVLNYGNLNAMGIATVSTQAVFMTRVYETPEMVNALSNFRACAMTAIPRLKDKTGTHAKWQDVDVKNRGRWPWYDLPVAKR